MITPGDGNTTAATLSADLDGTPTVSGSHTFRQSLTVTEGARTAAGRAQVIVKTVSLLVGLCTAYICMQCLETIGSPCSQGAGVASAERSGVDMSQEEMKKLSAKGKMVQETSGDLGRPPQGSDAVRSMGRADPLSFQAATYPVGEPPIAVAVGDFNNDGKLDIVTANQNVNSVSVLLGNGDGTFQSPQEHLGPLGSDPVAVAVGDFTKAGYQKDIVTANGVSSVSVWLSNGDGTFEVGHYPVGARPTAVAVGDFNNDGNLDIVTANFGDTTVSVLLGKGGGAFQGYVNYDVGAQPNAVAVGDFTNDGNLDIVTANPYDNTVSVLLNNGNGTGTFQEPPQTYRVGSFPNAVAVGDFNHDGYLDIVTANYNDNTISVLLNNGDGSGTFQAQKTYPVGLGPVAVAVFNNDGKLGIVTANIFDDTASILLGKGDGTFILYQYYPLSASPSPSSGAVAVGDFTNDGNQDIVVASTYNDMVTVLLPPPPLAVQVTTIQATATVPFNGAVAIIRGASSASDTTASIDWGDGTAATSGTVSDNPDGTLTVSGAYTYTTPGTFPLTVSAAEGTLRGSGAGQAIVQPPPPLDVQVDTIYPTLNVPFDQPVATIRGARGASDTTATIDWGDGTSETPGTVSDNGDGTLTVSGAHTYVDNREDNFILTVSADDGVRSGVGKGQALIIYSSFTLEVNYIQATVNIPFNGAVATIIGASSASDTTATIDWGDGTSETPGTLVVNNDGTLTVNGTHTYSQERTYFLVVTATEGDNFASNPGFAFVKSDTAVQVVQVNTIQATAQERFRGTVATISGIRSASDTTVMIDWGDGTAVTPGILVPHLDSTLGVRGSHIYSRGGTFPVTVTVKEGARTATGRDRAIVKAARVKRAHLHARAFGVQRLTPPQGPFGDVSIPSTGGTHTVTVPSVGLSGSGLSARAITDTVSGALTTTPPLASASSTIGDLHGFGIVASGISATAHADLSRLRRLWGSTAFATLTIGSTTFPAHFAPQANQVIPFADGSGTVMLNEQTITRRGNRLLIAVNALHLRIIKGPQAGTDIVVGHAEAGIRLS